MRNICFIRVHSLLLEIANPLLAIIHGDMAPPFRDLLPTSSLRTLEDYDIASLRGIACGLYFLKLNQGHEIPVPLSRQDDGWTTSCLQGPHRVPSTAMDGLVASMCSQMSGRLRYVECIRLRPNEKGDAQDGSKNGYMSDSFHRVSFDKSILSLRKLRMASRWLTRM